MARWKSDREYGSVDGDTNAKAILQDRRLPSWANWLGTAQALLTIAVAVTYGYTGAPGWLAFLVLNVGWMVTGTVTTALHQHMSWLQIIERRCQLLEQDADDLAKEVRQIAPGPRPQRAEY
jgi:hypothetical protein